MSSNGLSDALKAEQKRVLGISFTSGGDGGTIDIVSKYPWIADESISSGSSDSSSNNAAFQKRNNVPYCYAIERVSAVNASIANIANMVNTLGDQLSKGVDTASSVSTTLLGEGAGKTVGEVGSTVVNGVKDIFNQLKSKFKFDELLKANNLNSQMFGPYQYLYITKASGKKFVFPLATNDSSFSTVKNKWGAMKKLPGFLGDLVGTGIEKLKTFSASLNILNNLDSFVSGKGDSDMGNVDETPKTYTYPTDGDSLNVAFTLYNTTRLNAWKDNYRFLLLFVLRNLPMRIDAFTFTPPVLYDIIQPGVKRLPVCCAENIKIVPKGMVRTLTCENFIKGSGTITVNVPEAWEVNITFKSLIGTSANMILSELTGSLNVSTSKTDAAPATPPAEAKTEAAPATSETQEVPQTEPLPIPNTPPPAPPQLG